MNETSVIPQKRSRFRRTRLGILLAIFGLGVFTLGAEPTLVGLDRSPVIGFVQIAVFLIGLGLICLGGYASLSALWVGGVKTIPGDIGQRMVATGYVIAFATGMADIFGFGSQQWPTTPHFGGWQATGVLIGQAVIGIGFLLLIPIRQKTNGTFDPSRPAADDITDQQTPNANPPSNGAAS